MKEFIIALAAVLAACSGTLPADPVKMTPDQLKAAARDKNATASCSNAKTAAGNVTLVYVNLDQALPLGSQAVVEDNCKVTITTTTTPKKD